MSTCVTIPTETQFSTFTVSTETPFTTSFVSTITLPPSTTTITSTICLEPSPQASPCTSTTLSTTTSTVPGGTTTTLLPTTNNIPTTITTSTPTRTLFSTSCITIPTTDPPSTPVTPSQTTDPPLSTPDPSVVTSASSSSTTLPNGSVVITSVVVTKTIDPGSSVFVSGSAPALNHDGNGDNNNNSHKASLIGGVVGGVVGLVAIIAGIWFIWRRSKRWSDIFDEEEDEKSRRRMALDHEDVQPRPYQYGLVEHSASPSPPVSPRLRSLGLGDATQSTSALNVPRSHSRSSSGGAISMDSMGRRSYPDIGSASNSSVRPSFRQQNVSTGSSASTRPLLERPIRPPSSWSIGGQHVASEVAGSSLRVRSAVSPRPNSAGGALQSSAIELISPPVASPRSEKQRMFAALPPGAAAPVNPSLSSTAGTPTTSTPVSPPVIPSSPPPLSPRNPARPSTGKSSKSVVVHRDAGPAPAEAATPTPQQQGTGPDVDLSAPPAYSPT